MLTTTQKFYIFLSACGGNWRSSIYISCPKNHPGYLLSADRDGSPLVIAIEQFQRLSGELIDPTECCGQLTEDAFRSLYAQYLLWRLPSAKEHPLECFCQEEN